MRNSKSWMGFIGILGFLMISIPVFGEPLLLVSGAIPPYSYQENGKATGFAVDLVTEIFRRIGTPIKIEYYPWKRALFMLKTGRADAMFPMAKTPERETYAEFPCILTVERVSFYVHENSRIVWDGNLSSLAKYTFGRPLGYRSGAKFDNAVKNGVVKNIEQSGDLVDNIKKLHYGRIDVLVLHQVLVLHGLKFLDERMAIKELAVYDEIPAYLSFSRQSPNINVKEMINKYKIAIHQMKIDGSFKKISDSFLGK